MNLALMRKFRQLAAGAGCTAAQLALAWLLRRSEHILPIFGTTSVAHLAEDWGSAELQLEEQLMVQVGTCINNGTIRGRRYNPATQSEINTEEF